MKQRISTMHHYMKAHKVLRYPYAIFVVLAGIILILAGIAMLVLPGPGLVTIFFGIALLATQFTWAQRLTNTIIKYVRIARLKLRQYFVHRKMNKRSVMNSGASNTYY